MPAVPLGLEAYSRAASFQPETRLLNLYVEEDKSGASLNETMLLQRPGLVPLDLTAAAPGAIRGVFQSDNNTVSNLPIIVSATKVYRLNGNTLVEIGTVANDGLPVSIAATFERLCFVSAGLVYTYNGTNWLPLAVPDNAFIVDVDVLNGYFIFGCANGRFYWMIPGTGTIDPLDYATAEALPDGLVAVRRLRDDIFLFGSESIEVWQATGDADATFQRAPGRLTDRGCMSRDSVVVFDNSLVWVGEDGIVYRMSDVPKRISTFGIEERIKGRTDEPRAWQFTSYGHKFYVLNIPGSGTFCYDPATEGWCEFGSAQLEQGWLPTIGTDVGSLVLCGDSAGKLYKLDPTASTDDGVPFVRLCTGTIAIPYMPLANSSLAVAVGTASEADFFVRWADPRRGWSNGRTVTARGGSEVLNLWKLGLCRAPYRTFEISTVANQLVRFSGAVANEGWRV